MKKIRFGVLYNHYQNKALRFVRICISHDQLRKAIKAKPLALAA